MRELLSLTKVSLNVNFGFSVFKHKFFKEKKDLWEPIVFVVAILSLIPLYIGFIKLLNGLYEAFHSINQGNVMLLIGFLLTQMIIFMFGIIYVVSKFYFANDLEILIPLPIQPRNIIASKFITLVVNEYLTSLPIIIPIVIVFGIRANQGILYWFYGLVAVAVLPVIPLGIATLLVMFFMRFTNVKGKRDMIRIIGFIVMIVVILGVQIGAQMSANKVPVGEEQAYLSSLVKENNALVQKMGTGFPPSVWASMALSGSNTIEGFLYLVLFAGLSLFLFYLMILLGERVFYKGLIGGQEVTAKKKKLSEEVFAKKTSQGKHPIISIFLREMRILIRTPIFLMNSIGAVIIIPVALLVPLITSGEMLEGLDGLINGQDSTIIALAAIGFLIFIAGTNGVGSTTFSREGRQFWISRILPVRVESQLMGKILSGLAVQLLAVVELLVVGSFIIKIDALTAIVVLILGLVGSIPILQLGMTVDIIRPLLDWDNPQKAMKQNLNVLFSIVIGLLYIVLYGALAFVLYKIQLETVLIYMILLVIFSAISWALFKLLTKITTQRYREIE